LTELNDGAASWLPDNRFDDPAVLAHALVRRVLPAVSQPARYIGGELGTNRQGYDPAKANILLGFPDAYEIGMSHQGLRILYTLVQKRDDSFCDLFFAPWPDMEAKMREEGLPVFGLESRRRVRDFDLVGFSLGYELAYTNMLTMINLSGSPLRAADRTDGDPIFIAGGSCTSNPSVVGPFLDLVLLGDGEEAILDMAGIISTMKAQGKSRAEILDQLRQVEGAWHPETKDVVRSRVLQDLNTFDAPEQIVPIMTPVHDRLALEVMRGCVRGCRFCQAGMITRPVRERDAESLIRSAQEGIADSGLSEVSLLSLSTSDFTGLSKTVVGIQDSVIKEHTNLVLPSLRVDSVDEKLFERVSNERPTSFTFAPEAGSQKLRDVINKNITEEDILRTAGQAFDSGVKNVKLYFMIGLPTENDEDLDDLITLVGKIVRIAPRGGSQVNVSISPFSPKCHTPFQWAGQISRDEINRRNDYLARPLRKMKVKLGLRNPNVSYLEGVLGLGDAKLADVVERAWQLGSRYEGWTEHYHFPIWEQAFHDAGVDGDSYIAERDIHEPLPWDSVDHGVDKAFLQRDWRRSLKARILPDCRIEGPCYKCSACDGDIQHVFSQLEDLQKSSIQEVAAPVEGNPDSEADSGEMPKSVPEYDFDSRNEDPDKPGQELRKWQIWRQQAAAKCWYRVEFKKSGDMVFLGHLDFQRQLHLALRRSNLPAAYSKGYHPHPLIKFGPPLPVGVVGMRECFDIAMEQQVPGWHEAMNKALPDGLQIVRVMVVGTQTPKSIDQCVERSDYVVNIPGPHENGPTHDEVATAVANFTSTDKMLVVKKRPKGDIEIDARALVPTGGLSLAPEAADDGGSSLTICLLRSESGASLSVNDFLTALLGDSLDDPGHCFTSRKGYYGRHKDGRWITPLEEVGESRLRYYLSSRMEA
jgi:radical SAM-linked protein